MANDLRYRRLKRARVASLAGQFSVAYKGLDELLRQNPDDIEAHQLYANVLETDAFSEEDVMPTDARLKAARHHYRDILRVDSSNLFALFDLAEHFSNIGKSRVARALFEEFLRQSEAQNLDDYEDELARATAWLSTTSM
jgi:tetratricopeptide (TPR) repeat protein